MLAYRSSRWGARLVVLMVALGAMWLAAGGSAMHVSGAQDGASTSAAGILVETGEGEPAYIVVAFDETSINALDLLRAADLDTVSVEFGGLGEAVCSIMDTGCDVSTCRKRVCQTGDPESPFWQYWELDDQGEWSWSVLGASHAEIEHGDIAAWVWTGAEPDLESIAWEELVERAGAPDGVARGEVESAPAVYASIASDDGNGSGVDRTGTLAAMGIVALVGATGGWLVLRNRRTMRAAE